MAIQTPQQPPRPNAVDIYQAGTAVDPYDAIASYLSNQISLSEGLRQSREAGYQGLKGYTQGTGTQAVQTLVNPENRAFGQNPVEGLTKGSNLNQTFSTQLDKSLEESSAANKNILDALTALFAIQKQKDSQSLSERQLKLDEAKLKIAAQESGISFEDDGSIKIDAALVDPTTKAYVEQLKNGTIKNITNIPAESRDKVVRALTYEGINVNELTRQIEVESVKGVLQELYNSYYGNVGTGDDLSKGRLGGTSATLFGNLGLNDKVSAYNKFKNGIVATLKSTVGDSGVLTNQDIERINGLIPSVTANAGEAKLQWDKLNALLKSKYRVELFPQEEQTTSSVGKYKMEVK